MRWPWVRRGAHAKVVALLEQEHADRVDAELDLEEARVALAKAEQRAAVFEARLNEVQIGNQYLREQLEAKDAAIMDLRRQGFDPPDPRPPTVREMRAKIDPAILHSIEQIAQPGTKEHFGMLQEAEALVAAYPERPAQQIADEVTEGSPISPWRL